MPIPESWLKKTTDQQRVYPSFNGTEAHLGGIYPNVPGVIDDIQKLDGVHGDQTSIAAGNVDFGPAMALLAKYSNNFFRHWVTFYPNFVDAGPPKLYPKLNSDCTEKSGSSLTSAGQPWKERYSPFMYNRILKRWDLWRYNEEYFQKLRKMIKRAYDHGIVVQLTLLDRCGLDSAGGDHCLRWHYSPWNDENNVNKVIANSANGVNDFYKRNLMGEIRYRDRNADRGQWPDDHAPGPAPIVVEDISLGELQDDCLTKVILSTLEFPNVVYEIMNEPIHSHNPPTNDPAVKHLDSVERATWANTIVDVLYWSDPANKLTNYQYLDGVIFHGDVKAVHPNDLPAWTFRKSLMIQVSTDGFDQAGFDCNHAAAQNAFTHQMIFQAETNTEAAADGIHNASPPPTILTLTPLVGTWIKTGEDPASPVPHLFYTQRADGTVTSFNPDNDQASMEGRVAAYLGGRIQFWNNITQSIGKHKCTLLAGNSQLRLERDDGWIQNFKRYTGLLTPFFYRWKKVSENPITSVKPFYLFVYPDNTMLTRRISDNMVTNRGRITNATATQIAIHSDTFNNDVTWNYRFSAGGQHLTLEKADHSWTQEFQKDA